MVKVFRQAGFVALLPLYFLLHNYNELSGFIPVSYLLLFGLGIYLFAGLVWVITKSWNITFWCLVFVLFWGAWHDLAKAHFPISRYIVLLPVTLLLLVAAGKIVKKEYLNMVVLILCAIEIISFRKKENLVYTPHNVYTHCNQPTPDIYFIIFDEYTNNRTLQRHWQYDNSGITNWLSQQGFYCPDSSKANYSFTPYSISSILNMDYIAVEPGDIKKLPVYTLRAVNSLKNNETVSLLKNYQFHFINFHVTREFDGYAQKKLVNHTFPGRIINDFTKKEIDYTKKDGDNRFIIDSIKSTANTDTSRPPQFVYGHLMTTHYPHIYDSLGNISNKKAPLFDTYINQVKQANKQIQELVAHIRANNRQNTLIIIEGDHGFRRLPDTETKDYFPNFTAFYFPGKAYPMTLNNISAVNTFRIVFNQYFCQNLKLLKDSSIIVKY